MRLSRVFQLVAVGIAVAAALRTRRVHAPGIDGATEGVGTRVTAGTSLAIDADSSGDIVAEASEQSFPASDPPGWIRMRS